MLLATCGSQLLTWMMQRDYFWSLFMVESSIRLCCTGAHCITFQVKNRMLRELPATLQKALLFNCLTLLSATIFQCREDCAYLWSSTLHLDTDVYGQIIIKLGNMVARKPTNRNTQI